MLQIDVFQNYTEYISIFKRQCSRINYLHKSFIQSCYYFGDHYNSAIYIRDPCIMLRLWCCNNSILTLYLRYQVHIHNCYKVLFIPLCLILSVLCRGFIETNIICFVNIYCNVIHVLYESRTNNSRLIALY